jgi:hypothetical protein
MSDANTLAKEAFSHCDPKNPQYHHLVARGLVSIQGTPIDVEWLRQHYASYNTVLLRLPSSWSEAWGQDVRLSKPFDEITLEELKAEVTAYFKEPDALSACPKCGSMTWNRKHYPSEYRDERCSDCWMSAFSEDMTKQAEKQKAKNAARDAKRRAEGFTHKTLMWVHPQHGDDYQVEMYSRAAPTPAEIQTILRRRKSQVLTDHTTVAL